ncbi:MAG: Hsp20/alpha crystallin family protein [Planctomycetaceae bacterium]|nr:Hsp20/alpha crystallin family protein [Planctomycetaceae bacterium]
MTRGLTPWTTRFPRLFELEGEWPKWMTEMLGSEGMFGRDGRFLPEANIAETDKAVEVTVELPGMKPEDVKVELREGTLWITGEKREEKEETGKTFHRVERRVGSFRRGFALPAEVEEDQVDAKFEGGVLHITLPKAEKVAPKQIVVK